MFSILVFVGAGVCVYRAREFASAAPSQRATTAQDISIRHYAFPLYWRLNDYRCDYSFSVDGATYNGHENCPQLRAHEASKGSLQDSSRILTGANVAVYFDPANPSLNSLLDFGGWSARYYQDAILWIGLGMLSIFFTFIFGRLLDGSEKRRRGGVAVDAGGTVIYPEEIDVGSEFTGIPDPEVASSTSSPGLRERYLEVVNKIHPDRAANEADLAMRERLMKEANAAFERGDAETLRRVLEEYKGAIPAS